MFTALMMVARFEVPGWAALGACFALAVVVFLFVFYIHPDASDLVPHRTKLDQLLERRDTIYDNLRDLKFEHRAGKYSSHLCQKNTFFLANDKTNRQSEGLLPLRQRSP
jgi:hypothetical protein